MDERAFKDIYKLGFDPLIWALVRNTPGIWYAGLFAKHRGRCEFKEWLQGFATFPTKRDSSIGDFRMAFKILTGILGVDPSMFFSSFN